MAKRDKPVVGERYKIVESFGEGYSGDCIDVREVHSRWYARIRTPIGLYTKRAEDLELVARETNQP